MSNLFISYSRKDIEFVKNLHEDLANHHLSVWIDHEALIPGTRNWEEAILSAIKNCDVVLWIATPASKASDYVDWELAIASAEKKTVYPVWANGDDWLRCVPAGKHKIQYADLRGARYATGLSELLKALTGDHPAAAALSVPKEVAPTLPAGKDPRNPYKGLNAFTQSDAGDFFGRSALIEELQRMVEARLSSGERFLAVLGPSGAGKSSVVMAGLLPSLGAEWHILPRVVPDKHPLENLADALHSALGGSLAALEQDLNSGAKYLSRLARSIGKRVLLYVDQFEEVFTQSAEDEHQRFIDLLTYAISEPDGSLFVVLSMRADFYDRPMHYGTLGALIARNQVSVLPMSISELYEAIQKPALLPDVGLTFEDGLVSEIVFELRARNAALEGALPFLEFTLTRLYAAREGTRLTRRAYEAMGGVEGAIGNHADALFAGITAAHGEAADAAMGRVFLPLTNIDLENGKATRRRAAQADLPNDPAATALWQAFVAGRLLQTGDSDGVAYIEVAHEALFRSWERLKAWIAGAQEDLRLHGKLSADAADWVRAGSPYNYGGFYAGELLVNAYRLFTYSYISNEEKNFLKASEKKQIENDRLGFLQSLIVEIQSSLDVDRVISVSLEKIAKVIPSQATVFLKVDADNNDKFHITYNSSFEKLDNDTLELAQSLAEWMLSQGASSIIFDDLDPTGNKNIYRYKSAILVNIQGDIDIIGIIILLNRSVEAFSEDDLKLVIDASTIIAPAINSNDLYQLIRAQSEKIGTLLTHEQEEEQKFVTILQAVTDGIVFIDPNSSITLFNNSAERLLSVLPDRVINQHFSILAELCGESLLQWSYTVDHIHDSDVNLTGEISKLGDYIVRFELIPLYIGDQFLGTLSIFRRANNDF